MAVVRLEPDPKDADRTRDVLDTLVAEIFEFDIFQPLADLVAHRARNTNAARLGERFQTGGDIDTIAKDVVVLDNHIAEVDADAELNPSRRRDIRVASRHPALDLGSAQDRIDNALEFDQHAVAGGLDNAAVVLCDGRIDELDPMGLETGERPRLVDLHQPAKADHVGGKDRRKPALWSRHAHVLVPSQSSLADVSAWPKLASRDKASVLTPSISAWGRSPCRIDFCRAERHPSARNLMTSARGPSRATEKAGKQRAE